MKIRAGRFFLAAALTVFWVSGCSSYGERKPDGIQQGIAEAARNGEEEIRLTVRTAEAGGTMDRAGEAVAAAIQNTVEGAKVMTEPSKGSAVNILNIQEGEIGLGLVYGDLAGEAYSGTGAYEGNRQEKLCAIGACYFVGSLWTVREDSELTRVNELQGMILAAGDRASKTETASRSAFQALGIHGDNTEIWNLSLAEGRKCLEESSVDAAHEFREIRPEEKFSVLTYEDREIEEILKDKPFWTRMTIPEGTFPGQTKPVSTFGVKILLCASADMDEELAYEIAKAMDLKAGEMAEQFRPLEAMKDSSFRISELPLPLHPGAQRYYEEGAAKD